MSWLTGIVQSLKEVDLEAAVAKTTDGINNLKETVESTIREKVSEVDAEAQEIKAAKLRQEAVKALPWEVREERHAIVGEDLMERVLGLSLEEDTFTQPPPGPPFTRFAFDMEEHVQVITRLLELDPNLAKAHYRLSSKMDEALFWRHYFHRCALLRADVGVDPPLRPAARAAEGRNFAEGHAQGKAEARARAGTAGGGSLPLSSDGWSDGGSSGGSGSGPYAGSEPSLVGGEGGSGGNGGSAGGSGGGGSDTDLDALDAEVNAALEDDGEAFDDDDMNDLDGELDAELEAEIAAELEKDDEDDNGS